MQVFFGKLLEVHIRLLTLSACVNDQQVEAVLCCSSHTSKSLHVSINCNCVEGNLCDKYECAMLCFVVI